MSIKLFNYDAAEFLDSPEAMAVFIEDIMESNDPAMIANGIGVVARAKGMTDLAKATGIGRESLYQLLGKNGNPTLKNLTLILNALGMQLSAKPLTSSKAS